MPTGPLGDVIYDSGLKAGVNMHHVARIPVRRSSSDISLSMKAHLSPPFLSIFCCLTLCFGRVPMLAPSLSCRNKRRSITSGATVHLRCKHPTCSTGMMCVFPWCHPSHFLRFTVVIPFSPRTIAQILGSSKNTWLHMTGITPMISSNVRVAVQERCSMWTRSFCSLTPPCSLFTAAPTRHDWPGLKLCRWQLRKTFRSAWTLITENSLVRGWLSVGLDSVQANLFWLFLPFPGVISCQGTLEDLWTVTLPHLATLELLILSITTMVELAELDVGPS